jgi:hypothetical protein
MVLGLLTIAAIPTVIGVSQAVSSQKQADEKEKEAARFSLTATAPLGAEGEEAEVAVVLANGEVS